MTLDQCALALLETPGKGFLAVELGVRAADGRPAKDVSADGAT
ncbi:hypothetical protein [Amycolatopsis rifamycinica]|nr:hypothetical protein [Amycolatopsis rifamycinica]